MDELRTALGLRVIDTRAIGRAPTDAELTRIRALAGRDIDPERLFLLPYAISSTDVDEHYTWFTEALLTAFAAHVNDSARGIPLLEHHDGHRFPIGRVFHSETVPDSGASGRAHSSDGAAGILAAPADRKRVRLDRTAYMVRDHEGAASRIALIEDGVQQDLSLSVIVPRTPMAMVCDVCGSDYRDWQSCAHLAGWAYAVEGRDEPVIATVHYTAGLVIEDSLVYVGSNPAAAVARQYEAAKAARQLEVGKLDIAGARALEARLGFGIVPSRSFDMGRGTAAAPEKEMDMANPGGATGLTAERLAEMIGQERAANLALYDSADPARAAVLLLLEEARAAKAEAGDASRQHAAQVEAIGRALGIEDGEPVMAGVSRVMALAELGKTARAAMVARYQEAVVRAYGEDAPAAEDTAVLTAAWSVEQLSAETARLAKVAGQLFTAGRQTQDRDPETDASPRGEVLTGSRAAAYAG